MSFYIYQCCISLTIYVYIQISRYILRQIYWSFISSLNCQNMILSIWGCFLHLDLIARRSLLLLILYKVITSKPSKIEYYSRQILSYSYFICWSIGLSHFPPLMNKQKVKLKIYLLKNVFRSIYLRGLYFVSFGGREAQSANSGGQAQTKECTDIASYTPILFQSHFKVYLL